jgi:hypothetical protein
MQSFLLFAWVVGSIPTSKERGRNEVRCRETFIRQWSRGVEVSAATPRVVAKLCGMMKQQAIYWVVGWSGRIFLSLPRETTQIFSVLLVAVFLKRWVVRHCAVILFFLLAWPVWGRLHEIHTWYHWYHHGHEQSVLLTSIDRNMTRGRKGRGRAKGKRTRKERLAAASLEVRNG